MVGCVTGFFGSRVAVVVFGTGSECVGFTALGAGVALVAFCTFTIYIALLDSTGDTGFFGVVAEFVGATFVVFCTSRRFVLVAGLGAGLGVGVTIGVGWTVVVGGTQYVFGRATNGFFTPFTVLTVSVRLAYTRAGVVGASAAWSAVGVGLTGIARFATSLITGGAAWTVSVAFTSRAGQRGTQPVGTGGVGGDAVSVVLAFDRGRDGSCRTSHGPTSYKQ